MSIFTASYQRLAGCVLIAAAASGVVAATGPAVAPAVAAWAYPAARRAPPADDAAPVSLPGSDRQFPGTQFRDMTRAVDWFPAAHAPLPAAIAGRGDGVPACGYCHLPGGEGRVENASLAGLPPDYIREQVAAFRAGTREAAIPGYGPTGYMRQVAHQVAPADVAAAAAYFSQSRYIGHVHVVEAATVPVTQPVGFILAPVAGAATEALGPRIVELPDDLAAFEKRDPRVTYTAYVPSGSLTRGAAVVARVGCASCHGDGMKLWGAGRSPTYIFRQLLAFQTGARHDAGAAPMTAVAAQLTTADMVSVAAYWGSLRP